MAESIVCVRRVDDSRRLSDVIDAPRCRIGIESVNCVSRARTRSGGRKRGKEHDSESDSTHARAPTPHPRSSASARALDRTRCGAPSEPESRRKRTSSWLVPRSRDASARPRALSTVLPVLARASRYLAVVVEFNAATAAATSSSVSSDRKHAHPHRRQSPSSSALQSSI